MIKVKIGDIIKVQDCHHAESHCYEVDSIRADGYISQPACFHHRKADVIAVYRFDGKDYKCIWEKGKDVCETSALDHAYEVLQKGFEDCVNKLKQMRGKRVECINCKKVYDCENTHLGGCADGEEWGDEND